MPHAYCGRAGAGQWEMGDYKMTDIELIGRLADALLRVQRDGSRIKSTTWRAIDAAIEDYWKRIDREAK